MKKYPQRYGEDRTLETEAEAIKSSEEFIDVVRNLEDKVREKSYHLYLEDDMWTMFANSMKDAATGTHIKEFIV